jgi:hypothetical protein
MKLYQILIEAGVTPDDLHPDCKFIAQDGDDGLVSEYKDKPRIFALIWQLNSLIRNSKIFREFKVSDDWQTPLSREQFTADYEAHCATNN